MKSILLFILVFLSINLFSIDTLYLQTSYKEAPDTTKVEFLEKEALKYIDKNRTYALILFQKAETLAKENHQEKKLASISKALSYLYLSKGQNDLSKKYLRKAEHAYRLLGDYYSLGFIYNMWMRFYSQQSVNDSAVVYFRKGIEAVSHMKDKESKRFLIMMAILHTNYGNFSYFNREDYDEALIHYDSAYYYANLAHDTMRIAASYSNKGIVYVAKKEYKKAEENYLKAYQLNLKTGNRIYAIKMEANLGDLYAKQGKEDKALPYKKKAYLLFKEIGNKDMIVKSGSILAMSLSKVNQNEDAIKLLYELIKDTSGVSLVVKHSLLNVFINYYKSINRYDSVFYFVNQANSIQLAIEKKKNYEATEKLIISYKTKETKKENEMLKAKNEIAQKQKIFLIISLVFLILIIGLLIFILQQRKKLQKARRESLEQENKRLSETLELKNKELTMNTINLIRHSEYSSSLINKLSVLYKTIPEENKKDIMSVIQRVKTHNNTALWDDFYKSFTEVKGAFFKVLDTKYPDLSKNERKLSALLKLELTTKDIAALTNTTVRGVETARYRLRKKLKLNPETNLCQYFRGLS